MKQVTNQKVDIKDETNLAMRVSTISIIINLVLSLLKLFAGILGKSGAMISDAVHSASDIFSTFIVIIGVKVSNRKSDAEHQYGHERLECVASLILAVILTLTGIGIGLSGIEKITARNYGELDTPGIVALLAAIISIIVKEWMYWFTRAAAKKINSGALMADAWHHRSDALSSIGAFIGIFGARMGFPILDPIASVVICIFIEKVSFDIFKDSINKMIDKSCSAEEEEEMCSIILKQTGVKQVDLLKTRLFGSKVYVDVEFSMDGKISLSEAHGVAQMVHDSIEKTFPEVKHCMVHVNPIDIL